MQCWIFRQSSQKIYHVNDAQDDFTNVKIIIKNSANYFKKYSEKITFLKFMIIRIIIWTTFNSQWKITKNYWKRIQAQLAMSMTQTFHQTINFINISWIVQKSLNQNNQHQTWIELLWDRNFFRKNCLWFYICETEKI